MNVDVTAASRASDRAIGALVDFVARHHRLFVLTGAGCSTESGIPDYRDAAGGWKRRPPVMFQEFIADDRARRRYWARSLAGFPRILRARPNDAHHSLARLERRGQVARLVTQNVDGLHQAAGSQNVIDLHGRLDAVRCMGCRRQSSREELQLELARRNPDVARRDALQLPDGDADLDDAACETFDVPACEACGGILKPDVVFFGENVPAPRVREAMDAVESSDAMLVVGSSLMVYSGYRFVRAMADAGRPIAALTLGRTRADDLITLKVTDHCSRALRALTS